MLVSDGIISAVGKGIPVPPGFSGDIYDANGAYVTPGLVKNSFSFVNLFPKVDLHSHLGVNSLPEDARGNSDTNERTSPTTPFLRAMDAINPADPAIKMIREGGVTSSLVFPGKKTHRKKNIGNGLVERFSTRKNSRVEYSEIFLLE